VPSTECAPAKGWRCISVVELAADTEYHFSLQEKAARAKRFGLTVGIGGGVGGVVDEDFDVRWVPTGGLMVVYGIRF
jgi:hypothetical protein